MSTQYYSRLRDCRIISLCLLCIGVLSPVSAPAAEQADSDQWSVVAPLAERSLLLDGARADARIVVVGERGHVLISDDEARSWTQVPVPTRAGLNAVATFGSLAFAVGHDAVILRSRDGGGQWERVHYDPEQERPLLDVVIVDAERAVAVGAYGYFLETRDQGDSWQEHVLRAGEWGAPATEENAGDDLGEDFHLNAIAIAKTGTWFMAAEAGTVYRSDDAGRTWMRMPSPYEGSYFGVLPLDGDGVLLYGLQGRLFVSSDAGVEWREVDSMSEASLVDGLRLRDGAVIIVGHAGAVLVDPSGRGSKFELHRPVGRVALASIVELADGDFLLMGDGGVRRLQRERVGLP